MRARQLAFNGDTEMLVASRIAIRDEFKKHARVTDVQREAGLIVNALRVLGMFCVALVILSRALDELEITFCSSCLLN